MADLSQMHGVTRTVVRNLTGQDLFLSWFPSTNLDSWGIVLGAREQIRFNGNLYEALLSSPVRRAQLRADIQSGRVAVQACGDAPDSYDVVQAIGVRIDCDVMVFDSSSSAWLPT